MSKLRVWWIPQIGMENTFYAKVNSPKEGKLLIDTLANYDLFQFENNIKPDYCNTGGLEEYNTEEEEWECWMNEEGFNIDELDENLNPIE